MTVAFSFVMCWAVWRVLLWYLGTPEGKHFSKESLIFVGAVLFVGTIALVLQKSLRRKPQPQGN